jgi:hypothetical protein
MKQVYSFASAKNVLMYLAENSLFEVDYSCLYGDDYRSYSVKQEGLADIIEQKYPRFCKQLTDFIVDECVYPNIGGHSWYSVALRLDGNQIIFMVQSFLSGEKDELEPEGAEELCNLITPILPKINKIPGFEEVNKSNFDCIINFTYTRDEMQCSIKKDWENFDAEWKDYEDVEGADKVVSILEKFFIKKICRRYIDADSVEIVTNTVRFFTEDQHFGDEIKVEYAVDEVLEFMLNESSDE